MLDKTWNLIANFEPTLRKKRHIEMVFISLDHISSSLLLNMKNLADCKLGVISWLLEVHRSTFPYHRKHDTMS